MSTYRQSASVVHEVAHNIVARIENELSRVARRGLVPSAIYLGNVELDALRMARDSSSRCAIDGGGQLRFHLIPVYHVQEVEHFAVMGERRADVEMALR